MAVHKDFDSAFKALYKRLESVQNTLPTELAKAGTGFFISNFDKEGFQDGTTQAWKTPLRRIAGTPEYKYPKKKGLGRRTRKTLIKTGKLKRAVNKSVVEKSFKRIVWHVRDVAYAARHNEGLGGMPKREFIGTSRTLNKLFYNRIIQAYKSAFK